MKEKIYTIPVTEIFEEECFCPFCKLHKRLSEEEVKYAIGAAMMEPDYRAKTNKLGFCKEHIKEINSYPKALATALILESHLDTIGEAFKNKPEGKKGLFNKDKKDKFTDSFNEFNGTCAICEKIEYTFSRYMDTFIYMIDKNDDFLEKVLESDGFCMPHFTDIINRLKENVGEKKYKLLCEKLTELQEKKFNKYRDYIKEFVASFDYQNAGKPMNAPSDTVLKASWLLNGEFETLKKKLDNI